MATKAAVMERTALGLTVICAGGLMDAYSYLTRGHVFATGQTGNIVYLSMRIAELDFAGVAHYLMPISFFVVGILFSKHILSKVHAGDNFRMQRWVIFFEAVAFAVIAFLPPEVPDLLVNSLISLCAAVSFENFRTFGTKSVYASVFCTGNLRSFAETFYDGFVKHDTHEMHRSWRYLALICSFMVGCVLGYFLAAWVDHYAAFAISVIFLLALFFVGNLAEQGEDAFEHAI